MTRARRLCAWYVETSTEIEELIVSGPPTVLADEVCWPGGVEIGADERSRRPRRRRG